jgi:hypothetical protein
MLGRKTGGRQKGTRNKRTQDVIERLEALGCDPIEGMARLAMDENNTPELRGRMFAELAQFVAPKLKTIEHSGDASPPQYVVRVTYDGELDADTWLKRYGPGTETLNANGSGGVHGGLK